MDHSGAPALRRGLGLLRRLAADGPSSLEDLVRRSGWPKTSCLRLLAALEEEECVRRDPVSKRYAAACRLQPIVDEDPLRRRDAVLEQLAQDTGSTAEWWQLEHDLGIVLRDRREPVSVEAQVMARIGFIRPIHELEAVTRAALAAFPRRWPRKAWAWRDGQQTALDVAVIRALLGEVAAGAVACDEQPNSNGVRRYALPVADGVLALAQVCGPQAREPDPDLIAALRHAAGCLDQTQQATVQ